MLFLGFCAIDLRGLSFSRFEVRSVEKSEAGGETASNDSVLIAGEACIEDVNLGSYDCCAGSEVGRGGCNIAGRAACVGGVAMCCEEKTCSCAAFADCTLDGVAMKVKEPSCVSLSSRRTRPPQFSRML